MEQCFNLHLLLLTNQAIMKAQFFTMEVKTPICWNSSKLWLSYA